MCGYVSKHRPVSELWGLFSQEWELRYLVLIGTTLRYYKSERDAASFGPRGVVDVQASSSTLLHDVCSARCL